MRPAGWQVFSGSDGNNTRRRNMLARVAVEERRIETAVHTLASGLILAQEAERKRIAAELHDGINQDVAIIAIDLGLLAQHLPESAGDVKGEILRIQERTIALSNDIRNLSHELHPAVVEHLGLCAAIRVYCREFQRREGIEVEFVPRNVNGRFPTKVELALYRICQEALCNCSRHSGAHTARVRLETRKGGLQLLIGDTGCGFDVIAGRNCGGMGLISMWERARLAGGDLVIRSQLQLGTEVEAFIPLKRRTHETA